ncbi:hypothetical protein DITRI_Ditri16bG0130000 [Diplodiscus trichospermus]
MGQVLNGNPYNRKCDVYSLGICLWEIYCCDIPYPDLSFSEVTSAVVRQNLRPEIPRCCPSSLANIMKRCWDANPDKRPEMDEVVSMLEAIDTSKGRGMIPHDQPQGCLCFQRYRDLDILLPFEAKMLSGQSPIYSDIQLNWKFGNVRNALQFLQFFKHEFCKAFLSFSLPASPKGFFCY